jgi:hypothetical protein
MKINLGSGQRKIEGYVNVDKYDIFGADVVHDLDKTPWPFADTIADEVLATHVLEHLGQQPEVFLNIMKELYRIMKPQALLKIKVPHPRSDAFLGDPTHVRPITADVLSLFSKEACAMFAARGWANSPLALYIDVDFVIESLTFSLMEPWATRFKSNAISQADLDRAVASQNNVVDEIAIVLRRI